MNETNGRTGEQPERPNGLFVRAVLRDVVILVEGAPEANGDGRISNENGE